MASIALIYLARGADTDCYSKFERFVASYTSYSAGVSHRLYIILKGYPGEESIHEAKLKFQQLNVEFLYTDDRSFDLGSYADVMPAVQEEYVCVLNTNSEIASSEWLAKLYANIRYPHVGAVAATGSYESLNDLDPAFPPFPNIHLRSNAMLLRTIDAREIFSSIKISSKEHAFFLESGSNGISQQIFDRGMTCLVIGKDGRGYSPQFWPLAKTFRFGEQKNLLVHDNVTRTYQSLTVSKKLMLQYRTWGEDKMLRVR